LNPPNSTFQHSGGELISGKECQAVGIQESEKQSWNVLVKFEFLRELFSIQCIWHILLVCQYKENSILAIEKEP
jgi:hypothetical protein